jgi:hypothetical protein
LAGGDAVTGALDEEDSGTLPEAAESMIYLK